MVHRDGGFEEGGLAGSIGQDGGEGATGDCQQARGRTLLLKLCQHHTTWLTSRYLSSCAGWQPGVAHLQLSIAERSQFEEVQAMEGLYLSSASFSLVSTWFQGGPTTSAQAAPLSGQASPVVLISWWQLLNIEEEIGEMEID